MGGRGRRPGKRDQFQNKEWSRIDDVINSLYEKKRDWSVSEILDEFRKQGIRGKNGEIRPQTIYKHLNKQVIKWREENIKFERNYGIKIPMNFREGNKWIKPNLRAFENMPEEIKVVLRENTSSSVSNYKQGEIGKIYLISDKNKNMQKFWSLIAREENNFLSENPYWILNILRYSLREKLINEDYFNDKKNIKNISNDELDKIWNDIFNDSKILVSLFYINIENLLNFLKTEEGKIALNELLNNDAKYSIYKEAKRIWSDRDDWNKRFKDETVV